MHALHGRSPTPRRTRNLKLPLIMMIGCGGHGEPAGPRPRNDHRVPGDAGARYPDIDKPRQSTGYNARRAAMLTWVLRQSPPSSMTCGSQTCDQKDRTCYCICLRLPDQISSGEYQPSGHHCAHHIAAKRASAAGVGSAGAGCRQGGMQMADPVSCCNFGRLASQSRAQGETHGPALT